MHKLASQSLTRISTKLERERKGRWWIFNLSSTPTKGTQSSLKIWHIAMQRRERRGRTLTCLLSKCEKWGGKVRRKGAAAPKYPQLALLTIGALRSGLNRNIQVGQEKYLGKLLWLHAHPLEYPCQAGKISGRPLSVWAQPTAPFPSFKPFLRC
jgi:hypothetical protein